jgi:hypothetical protein
MKTEQYFKISSEVELSSEFSVCMWYLVTRESREEPWGSRLFDFSNGMMQDNIFLGRLKKSDKLALGYENGSHSRHSIVLPTDEFAADSAWRHVCVTKADKGGDTGDDGRAVLKVYLNGSLRVEQASITRARRRHACSPSKTLSPSHPLHLILHCHSHDSLVPPFSVSPCHPPPNTLSTSASPCPFLSSPPWLTSQFPH